VKKQLMITYGLHMHLFNHMGSTSSCGTQLHWHHFPLSLQFVTSA